MITFFFAGLGGVLACLAVFYYQHQQMQTLRQQQEHWRKDHESLAKEHHALISADLYFAKQLKEINNQIMSLDAQLQTILTSRENDGGYQHALKILEMGGNKQEILDSCHLSNAEAELLMNLQAYRSALKSP